MWSDVLDKEYRKHGTCVELLKSLWSAVRVVIFPKFRVESTLQGKYILCKNKFYFFLSINTSLNTFKAAVSPKFIYTSRSKLVWVLWVLTSNAGTPVCNKNNQSIWASNENGASTLIFFDSQSKAIKLTLIVSFSCANAEYCSCLPSSVSSDAWITSSRSQ